MIRVDFNALDEQSRVKASLRFASSPEIPATGEWVRLVDAEGNTCLGQVEEVRDPLVAVRPALATWIPGDALTVDQRFDRPSFREDLIAETATRGGKARATGQLQVA